jgi:hypothetical protein
MDNRYWSNGCPALMQDGRFITNYVRTSIIDQVVREVNGIKSSNEYRLFLQNNTENIINKERDNLLKNNTCNVDGKCVKLSNNSSN